MMDSAILAKGPVTAAAFRSALSLLGASTNIITTDGPAGPHGLTATAVCSVTDSPPTILVCVNRNSSAHDAIQANGVICVNVATAHHEALAMQFARPAPDPSAKFAGARWEKLATGAPVLVDACVSLDCRVQECKVVGTHSVIFCAVEAVATSAMPEGLVYFDRSFHPVGGRSAETAQGAA